jgi:hypothetical protein
LNLEQNLKWNLYGTQISVHDVLCVTFTALMPQSADRKPAILPLI